MNETCDNFIELLKKINYVEEAKEDRVESNEGKELIMIENMKKTSSEFVLESLLLKIQTLAI